LLLIDVEKAGEEGRGVGNGEWGFGKEGRGVGNGEWGVGEEGMFS
jgi:hypothetical protein